MTSIDLEAFKNRNDEEKVFMEQILEMQETITPAVKEGDIIKFEIERNVVEGDDIIGNYEIIVVKKNSEDVKLALMELDGEYAVLFSELSLSLHPKLIKALLVAIKFNKIVDAVNKMNRALWDEGLRMKEYYL
ncbi:hypothetical protein [Methanobacterium congolense]|uniref:Uncharacterized protein n=1 Tax=Methanobacterium congolense TaxID=118062 RepID=A0A1D3KZJ6_9EURY|nr:hypothetical protein [Methanobacterium congolense]SCG84703.1 Protein of unknown function (DUF421) [Methanobacterium congolense]